MKGLIPLSPVCRGRCPHRPGFLAIIWVGLGIDNRAISDYESAGHEGMSTYHRLLL